jgi:hypothetical protein
VEESSPLIFRVKGNIKAAGSYRTGVGNSIFRNATCVVNLYSQDLISQYFWLQCEETRLPYFSRVYFYLVFSEERFSVIHYVIIAYGKNVIIPISKVVSIKSYLKLYSVQFIAKFPNVATGEVFFVPALKTLLTISHTNPMI